HTLLLNCQIRNQALNDTLQVKRDSQKMYLDIVAAPKRENSGAILVLQDKSSHYKLLEMRKHFIANASHELKTPITIIRGFAETLYDNPELPHTTIHEVTAKIVKNCHRMAKIIKDLLTLADIENLPSFRFSNYPLVQLANSCKANL